MLRTRHWLLFGVLLAVVLIGMASTAMADDQLQVRTDTEIAGELGLLLGDGDGLTAQYLAKPTTRLQAAIMLLRLKGLQDEAMAYQGTDNFSDASLVNTTNQAVLAYLRANPELGWAGVGGGKFDPLSTITSQQFYKVILEALGYRTGTDFEYENTLAFAASKGLSKVAASSDFKNADIATATVEALKADTKDGGESFAAMLAAQNVIDAKQAGVAMEARIDAASNSAIGTYLVDGEGRTLYYFTKDAVDRNSCLGKCLDNWPIFYSEHLQIGNGVNKADIGSFTREDGMEQLTYKGWPLYYFANDKQSGDVNGENVGKVWFVIKQPFYSVMIGTQPELGNYLVDNKGMALYYFDKDTAGVSNCSGGCLENWPAFHTDNIVVPTGVSAADFAAITRADGSMQTTYKGFPLYYFVKDTKSGDVTGQALNDVWYIVNPETFEGTTAVPPADTKKNYTIEMKEFSFTPTQLTVEAGSTITFTNRDDVRHNAVAADGTFSTPLLNKGESHTVTLDKAGVYEYYCEPHKSIMTGTITVK